MNWDSFKKMPDSALKDITDKTINPDGSAKSQGPGNTAGTGNINDLGNHTENPSNGFSNTSSIPGAGAASQPGSGATSAGKLLGDKGADFAVTLMNFAIPALIYFMVTRGGYETSRDDWKLDKEERETVRPVMQSVLDKIMIDLNNPYLQLGVVLAIIYGAKGAENMAEAKKKKKDEVPVTKQTVSPVVPFSTIKKRTYDQIYLDELAQEVEDCKVKQKIKPEVAERRVRANKGTMKLVEKRAKEIFNAQQ